MFLDMNFKNILSLIIVGFVGGLLSGFIGSGGAFVLTPAMMTLGVPGAVAVASNMCHKFPKAMVGTYKRWKYGQVDLKLAAVMSVTAIIGVQIGIQVQKAILHAWGNAGSNLYVSTVFVIILVLVGGYVFFDAKKLAKGADVSGNQTSKLALAMQRINLPPMMHFKVAKVKISAWITIPVGLATGMLAATIAVGGFIGVPGMIYVIGASAMVASATELGIAFVMGAWGSIQWGLSGLIDIRLALLLLSASLIGVQLGALGTTYVKDYIIKMVMASVMLIVAVSRGFLVPGYLGDVGLRAPIDPATAALFSQISFWSLVTALFTSSGIIIVAMISGMTKSRREERLVAKEVINNG
ncbi:MAG: sulfite exporter TauE/SafE family protein [Deltaproteobacteria bacterium]|nr:sulfite exporter TauE/SafE family protein [Deltaproteobacteria bacterium]